MRILMAGVGMALCSSVAAAAESYMIDPLHTYPHFEINHLGFSTMHGRFNETKGELTIDWEKNMGSVDITINAASVDTGMKKRDDHLRSPDFLTVEEFPEIRYTSKKVMIHGGKRATVEGSLTLMGVTKPVTLEVASINCGDHPMKKGTYVCGFDAAGRIKRSDFGITYGAPAIGDEMTLSIEVEAHRK